MADRMSKMDRSNRIYAAIDLKSFYASVEVVDRKLDPMTTHLVVADRSRTSKTICLAVSPSLKAYGIPGRARLFEVEQKVEEVNRERRRRAPGGKFTGSSCDAVELAKRPDLALDFIAAPPQMAHYMEKSSQIYQIYLKYVAPEDIHSYSIDLWGTEMEMLSNGQPCPYEEYLDIYTTAFGTKVSDKIHFLGDAPAADEI